MAHSFAHRLRQLRETHGLSKSALARSLGVSTTCVWNWEEGNTEPRTDNLAALSDALRVSVEYLQSGRNSDGAPSLDAAVTGTLPSATLPEVIADAKVRIAHLAGIAPEKVNISLEY